VFVFALLSESSLAPSKVQRKLTRTGAGYGELASQVRQRPDAHRQQLVTAQYKGVLQILQKHDQQSYLPNIICKLANLVVWNLSWILLTSIPGSSYSGKIT
jgi:hypothetical protein